MTTDPTPETPNTDTQTRDGLRPGGLAVAVLLIIAILGFALLMPLDRWGWLHLVHKRSEIEDWHRLLRIAGYFPTWILLAVVLWRQLGTHARVGNWHPSIILLAPIALTAALSEILKIISKRFRPEILDGYYGWRSWADSPLSTGGIGLPSGHAATALAAAFILCRLYPRSTPVWLLLGFGCAATRVIAGAHFITDVYLSAIIAYAAARTIWYYAHPPSPLKVPPPTQSNHSSTG